VSSFEIDGRTYGGSRVAADDNRLAQMQDAFPDARTVLEVGCIDGGTTFILARSPGVHVTALDPRSDNIARARFAQRQLRVANVHFVVHDVEVDSIRALGRFDVAACLGLLSHLPNPADVVDDMAAAAEGVFLWTHVCGDHEVEAEVGGLPGRWVPEPRPPDPFAGLSPVSFWPTRDALVRRLSTSGLQPRVVVDENEHPHGPAVTVAAARAQPGRVA
jgi:SAM-dependent methyltransferase